MNDVSIQIQYLGQNVWEFKSEKNNHQIVHHSKSNLKNVNFEFVLNIEQVVSKPYLCVNPIMLCIVNLQHTL